MIQILELSQIDFKIAVIISFKKIVKWRISLKNENLIIKK